MCDGVGGRPINGGNPIRGRGSQQTFIRGCHVPSPGLDLEHHVLLRDLPEGPSDSTLLEAPKLDLAEDQRSNGVDDAEDDKYPHNSTPSRMGEALQEPPLGRQLPSPVHIQPLRRWSAVELRPTYAPNHQLLLMLQLLLAPVHPRQRQHRLPSIWRRRH